MPTATPSIRPPAARLALAAAVAGALASTAACSKDKGPPPPQTVPVVVATAATGDVPITIPSNGTVEPLATVAIQPQATGTLLAVHFTEGDEVQKGQILFEIDPAVARAAVAQARAVLARDRATAGAATRDADRYAALVKQGYVTQSQAELQRATATALASTIAADEAAVRAAELQLSYATVRAPISGKTGNLNVRVGNLVRVPSPVPLVTINAVTPIRVRFPVPDRALSAVRAASAEGHPLEAIVSGTATGGAVERGRVDFIDNAVDSVTGSVTLKARFANTDRRLWPGAFVPVTLTTGVTRGAVLVPAVAVQQGPQGAYVFMADTANRARQVPVVVDRTLDDVAVVAKGIAPGDRVVVDGQSRLAPGTAMKVAKVVATQMPGVGGERAGDQSPADSAAAGTPGAPATVPTATPATGAGNGRGASRSNDGGSATTTRTTTRTTERLAAATRGTGRSTQRGPLE